MSELKYYMNNPCTVVREIAGEFSEVKMIPNFTDDHEGSQWCFGCQLGSMDGAHPSHTCEDAQEIIDAINDSQAAIIVMVENRLLHDKPVEYKQIKVLQDDIVSKMSQLKEIEAKSKDLEETNKKSEFYDAELGIRQTEKYDNIKRLELQITTLQNEIGSLLSHKENVKQNQGKVIISVDQLRDLIKSDVKMRRLDIGGVDNWDWYGESLQEGGDIDHEVESELTHYVKR